MSRTRAQQNERWKTAVLTAVLVVSCTWSDTGSAHGVLPSIPDPDRDIYLLPGVMFSAGAPASTANLEFFDIGIEVTAHRFIPTKRGNLLTQFGYGALFQLQAGAIPLPDMDSGKRLGTNARLALGAQGTFSLFGLQAGLMTRAGSAHYQSAVGPFVGAFCSFFGLGSFGVQFDITVLGFGDGPRMPLLITMPATLKWVFPIEVSKPVTSPSE